MPSYKWLLLLFVLLIIGLFIVYSYNPYNQQPGLSVSSSQPNTGPPPPIKTREIKF